jgi:hypothetical protein
MRGHLQRRGKNSWRLKFDLGRASVGERSTTYITLKGTKAQAQAQALKILASTVTSKFVDPSQETVASFGERWLRDWASQNLRGKALERYSELLRKYVFPRVGGLPIQKAGC